MAPQQKATPKGKKRGAPSADTPGAKRVRDFLKEQGVSKSSHEAVREIVAHPEAQLPSSCCQMLEAMLPWALGTGVDERHEVQHGILAMLQETAEAIQGRLTAAFEAERAACSEQDAKRGALQGVVAEAEAALNEATAAEEAANVAHNEATSATKAQKKVLAEATAKEKKENKAFEKAKADKAHLEKVIEENFTVLKSGSWEEGQQDKLFKPIQALFSKLELDESLLTSLPISLIKRERGPFDDIVVGNFGETLQGKLAAMAAELQALEAPAAANVADVAAAKAKLEELDALQQVAYDKYATAGEATSQALSKSKEAKKGLSAFEPEYKQATAARKEKEDQLESFKTYNVAMLQMLVAKKSKKAEAEEAAAAAVAAAAAAEASAAPAEATEAVATATA